MKRQHSVLVIDDEPDVVESVRDLLRLQYKVLGATRPADALEILGQEPVDVVITDQRMPEMTGVELLHRVREIHPDTIRLLLTGYADIRAVVDAINLGGVYRYITKPWEPTELLAITRDAVERRDLIVQRQRLLTELTRANAELAKLSELKSNFIHVASHELRTPLAILLPLTYLATREPGVGDPMRSWLQNISAASDRLHRVVEQLTAMLAVERFERPLERRPVDLAALLREAVDDVRPLIDVRRQTLACDLGDRLGTICIDASKIRDSVTHLLLNAIKFTFDGGHIALGAKRTGDGGAEIRVSDTGIGIDGDSLPRIFEPFFTQLDVSQHSSGIFEYCSRGLGLGLSLVKGFVEMHGGRVEARSTPRGGSTFTVALPGDTGEALADAGAGTSD